jgi:hypothetical protein
MKIKLLISLAVLLATLSEAQSSTNVTLFAHGDGSSTATNVTLSVTPGQLARIIYWNAVSASLSMSVGGSSFLLVNGGIDVSAKMPIVVGPATFTLTQLSQLDHGFVNFSRSTLAICSETRGFFPARSL